MAVNAREYIKNVGKSFGYMATDYFGNSNPAVKALVKEAQETASEAKSALSELKEKAKNNKIENSFINGYINDGKDFINNFFSDIKSGKWYNKERITEAEEKLMSGFGGGDFDIDFDFDDDDFDTDFDIDDDDDNPPDINKTVDVVGAKVSEAVSMATAKSAEYIVTNSSRNTRAMMEQNNRLFYQVNTGLMSINSNISSLVSLGNDVSTHIQNSGVFFTKSTELQTKQVELLEKIVSSTDKISKNTAPIEKKQTRSSSSTIRVGDLLGSEDVLDLREYFEAIKTNIKNEISFFTDINDMFKDDEGNGASFLSQLAASPVKIIMDNVFESLVPKVLKESMDSFNKSLSGFFGSLLMNINHASSNNDIMSFILDMLHIDNSLKNTLDPSLYEKGKVDFDGITRKSIVEVIPTYLSKILSTLNGKDEIRFDYDKGSFKTISQIKQTRDDITRRAAESAGYDLRDEFREYVKDRQDSDELIKNLNEFFVKSVEKGDKFNYRVKQTDESFKNFGLTPKTGKILVDLLKDLEKRDKGDIALNFNKDIQAARETITDQYKRIEQDGGSVLNYLFNDSIDNNNLLATSPLNLNNIYDKYHNNVFYYLQGIYKFTKHVSDNVENIGGGSGPDGGGSPRTFKKVRSIRNNTPKAKPVIETIYSESKYEDLLLQVSRLDKEVTESNSSIDKMKSKAFHRDINKTFVSYQEYKNMTPEAREKYINKILEEKKKLEKQKEDNKEKKDKEPKGWAGRLIDGIHKILNKPAEVAADVLKWGNQKLLDIIYGKERDEDKGFLDTILDETKKLFSKFGEWVNKNIFEKLKLKKSLSEYFEDLFGKKGDDGKRHGGWFGEVGSQVVENFKSAGGWVKDSFVDVGGKVKDFFTGRDKSNAYSGGNVTKTGLVAVSEGELIIPSELNPYYKGKTDKLKQKRDEENIVNRFFGKFDEGGTAGDKKSDEEAKNDFKEAAKEKVKKAKESFTEFFKKYILGTEEDPGIAREAARRTAKGASDTFDQLFGSGDDEKKKEDREKIKKSIGTIIKEFCKSDNFSSMITGGIIGGGVSLLTGGVVSPILAAAVGSGVGLILKSDKVQKTIFGEFDEDGNLKNKGLLPPKASKYIKENIPDIAKFGTVGGIGGLLGVLPGGTVGGILIGSALGFATKSQWVKEKLFGTETQEGLISKEVQKRIKEAIPNVTAGALAGLIAGPFGLVGNVLVGSIIGYATSTEEFKNKLFGEPDENGKRHGGGVLSFIKEKILDPLGETMKTFGHEIKFQVKSLFKKAMDTLNKALKDIILLPLQKAIKDFLLKPLGKLARIILTPVALLGMGALKVVTGAGKALKKKQIKRGQASYMTAAERLQYREQEGMSEFGDKTVHFDKILKGMSQDQVSETLEYVRSIQDPNKELRRQSNKALNDIAGRLSQDDTLSAGEIYKITSRVRAGKLDKAMEDFDIYANKRGMDPERVKELRKIITQGSQDYHNLKDKQGDISSYVKEKTKEFNKKYGTNITMDNAWTYEDLLKGELKGRAKLEQAKKPEEKMMDQNEKHHTEIIEKMNDIIAGINFLKGLKPDNTPFTEDNSEGETLDINKQSMNNAFGNLGGTVNKEKEVYYSSTATGEMLKHVKNGQGDWVLDKSDKETIDIIEKQRSVQDAQISTARSLGGLGGTLGSVLSKLFKSSTDGEEEDKGETIFDKISDGITNIGGSLFNLPSIIGGFIGSAISSIGTTIKTLLPVALTAAFAGTVIRGAFGDEQVQELVDKVVSGVTGGNNDPGNSEGGNYYSKEYNTIDVGGTTHNILVDGNGNPIKDDQGNYISADTGKSILGSQDQWVTEQQTGRTLQSRIWEDFGRSIVGGKIVIDPITKLPKGFRAKPSLLTGSVKVAGKTTKNAFKRFRSLFGTEIVEKTRYNPLEVVDDATKEATEEVAESTASKAAKETTKNATKKVSKKKNRKAARKARNAKKAAQSAKEVVEETTENTASKVAKETTESATAKAIKAGITPKGAQKAAEARIIKTKAAQAAKEVAEETTENTASKLAKETVKENKKLAKNVIKEAGEKGIVNTKLYNAIMTGLDSAFAKLGAIMKKIPFLQKFAGNADDIAKILKEAAEKYLPKMGGKLASIASSLSSALVVLKIAFLVADFYTGYEDARTTLGIVEKPTEQQRILSGLLRMIKNLTLLGAIIPDKVLVSLFVNKIAPLIGLDMTDIERQREEAKNEVETYNKTHGTDYTIEDYNKKVLKDYTVTERASNFVKSVKKNIKEKGFIGAIKSGTTEYIENAKDTFAKNFEKGGPIAAIAETLDALFPSFIGDFGKHTMYMADLAIKGKPGELIKYDASDKDDNMLTKIFNNVLLMTTKTPMTAVALVVAGIKGIGKALGIENLKQSFDNYLIHLDDMGAYAVSGDFAKFNLVGAGAGADQGTLAHIFKYIALLIPRAVLSPIAWVTSGFKGLKKVLGIEDMGHSFGNFMINIGEMATYARNGDFEKFNLVGEDAGKGEGGIAYAFKQSSLFIVRAMLSPLAMMTGAIKGIGNLASNIIDGIKEKMKGPLKELEKFGDDPIGYITENVGIKTKKKKKKKNKESGKGSGIGRSYVGGSSGFISQLDSNYSDYKYGSSNVAEEGCGPAVATMAVNNALNGTGNVISMKDSLAYAKKKRYEQDNGTSADYFGDMFDQYGLDSEYTRNINGNKSNYIKNKLAKGSSVVLLGKDKDNKSKINSPFGPNNHYVLATGLDNNGNLLVNDPELNQPVVYDSKILDNTNLAISTQQIGGSSRIINKAARRFKVYIGGSSTTENEKQIYNFLTDKENGMGLNTAAACGILANIQHESGFRTEALGDSGTSYGICQWHNNRFSNLKKWCSDNGYDYKTLDGQLRFLEHELVTGYKSMLAGFKKAPNTAQGAYQVGYDWCYKFERPANKSQKSVERGNLAKNTYFPKYSGVAGSYDKTANATITNPGTYSINATETKSGTPFNQLLSLISSLPGQYLGLDNPLAKLLGFGDSSSEDTSTSILNTTGNIISGDGGTGNAKQKKLVELLKDKEGKLAYSQNGPRNPDKGSADCSSTVNWAYKKVFGKDIGNDTLSIMNDSDTEQVQVDKSIALYRGSVQHGTTSSNGPQESGLQPGDLLLYSRPTADYTKGRQYRVGHVEMYAGNGKRIGHGGPGKGPNISDLSKDKKRFIMAKRLKDVGSGSGIYDSLDYINTKHETGSIMSFKPKYNYNEEELLRNKVKKTTKAIGAGSSDETMITLVKSIVTILTTMANNSSKINTIVELLQNYFNAKNKTNESNKSTTNKTVKMPNTSKELDAATKELVDYLNSLAV